jgi:alkylation response protein AidB-like acyl-CoA dehydrogenase
MDFALSEEQQAIFDMARAFGEAEIAPHARDWDKAGEIPKDALAEAGRARLRRALRVRGPRRLGPQPARRDAGLRGAVRSCPSVAAFLSIHNMCAKMLESYGTGLALKAPPAPRAADGDLPLLLPDRTRLRLGRGRAEDPAVRTNEGYALTGTKAFISGGGIRTPTSSWPAPARTARGHLGARGGGRGRGAQLRRARGQDGLALAAHAPGAARRARVPAENLLGEEGHGFRYAMAGLDGGRLNIAACSLGAAQAALDATLAYMGERKAFGQSIDQFQALQFRLADMEIELEAARVFLRQAAWKLDTGARTRPRPAPWPRSFVTETGSRRGGPVPATSWRLRLPRGLRDREGGARPARAPDPRRHERDHAPDRGAQMLAARG